jgi:signal transduction histidine kinase
VRDRDSEPARSIVKGTADLNVLVARAAEDFSPARARLHLRPAPQPVLVDCDSTRTVQILTNLLSNALKYSPDDAGVEVTVQARDGRGVVAVHDHGRGIPSDQLEQVFEKFHRVEDPMLMSTGGSGLGLYIARHLALAMDGDLSVTSTLGQGSVFTLSLRLAPGPAPAPQ